MKRLLIACALVLSAVLPEERRGQGVALCPAPEQTFPYDAAGEPEFSFPLLNRLGASVECDQAIRTRVAVLLVSRRPSAVTGFVSLGVVDAIDARPGRPFAHVRDERLKAINPLGAHGDASGDVLGGVLPVRRAASPLGFVPRRIGAGSALAVRRIARDEHFSQQATAATGVAGRQLTAVHRDDGTALAAAQPLTTFTFNLRAQGDDREL